MMPESLGSSPYQILIFYIIPTFIVVLHPIKASST